MTALLKQAGKRETGSVDDRTVKGEKREKKRRKDKEKTNLRRAHLGGLCRLAGPGLYYNRSASRKILSMQTRLLCAFTSPVRRTMETSASFCFVMGFLKREQRKMGDRLVLFIVQHFSRLYK